MAKDTAIARAIVASLTASQIAAAFSRDPCTVVYSHDDYTDYETFANSEIRIMPGTAQHVRGSRADWLDGASITVKLSGESTDEKNADLLDAWLNFVDEIIDLIKAAKPVQKKAVRIESVQRYDKNMLRTLSVYSTTYSIVYSVI